jgi:hypothetical protein
MDSKRQHLPPAAVQAINGLRQIMLEDVVARWTAGGVHPLRHELRVTLDPHLLARIGLRRMGRIDLMNISKLHAGDNRGTATPRT